MFDGYVLTEDSVTNVHAGQAAPIGYEMRTRIPYYRGVPLSMVDDVQVEVDGRVVAPEKIRFSSDNGNHWFTLEEMWTVSSFRWEYIDEAIVRVLEPGGLAPGRHEVLLRISIRVAYILVGTFHGEMRRVVEVAA